MIFLFLFLRIINIFNLDYANWENWLDNYPKSNIQKTVQLPEEKVDINIFAGWDVMLSRKVWYLNKRDWYDRVFKDYNPISSYTGGIAFFNLESPFSDKDNDKNIDTYTFRANTDTKVILKEVIWKNTGVFSIANNHIRNSWQSWVDLTKKTILNQGFDYIWDKETNFLVSTISNRKVCYTAYTYDWDDKTIKKLSLENIKNDIKLMDKDNCFLKLLMLHWWNEYQFKPSESQQKLAHDIIDSWADIILWSHSHIFWEVENYKDKPIFYSLWNYIFDQNWWVHWSCKKMDCIYDSNLKKDTVPTYIGTLIHLNIDKDKNIKIVNINHHKIDNWAVSEYKLE